MRICYSLDDFNASCDKDCLDVGPCSVIPILKLLAGAKEVTKPIARKDEGNDDWDVIEFWIRR